MRAFPLSTLRLRCQQRCDKEGDPQIGDAANGGTDASEWNRLISEMYGELWAIVEKAGKRYFESTQTLTATGVFQYSLPADHLATIYIAKMLDGTTTGRQGRRLRQLSVQERNRWIGTTGTSRRYELVGQNVNLFPAPPTGELYLHVYMPQPPDLSGAADNASVDLVTPDGEAFLIEGVACKALPKSESDIQVHMAARDAAKLEFATWCALRAFNESPRVFVDDNDDEPGDGYPVSQSFYWNPPS